MPDENKNGIEDSVESFVYVKHAGRKFWLTFFSAALFFVFAFILLYRQQYEEMNDTLKLVLWIIGIFSGANVAQDFSKHGRH